MNGSILMPREPGRSCEAVGNLSGYLATQPLTVLVGKLRPEKGKGLCWGQGQGSPVPREGCPNLEPFFKALLSTCWLPDPHNLSMRWGNNFTPVSPVSQGLEQCLEGRHRTVQQTDLFEVLFWLICIFSFLNNCLVQLLSHVRLCDPVDCSTPGFPVLHQLPEFAGSWTHVH